MSENGYITIWIIVISIAVCFCCTQLIGCHQEFIAREDSIREGR